MRSPPSPTARTLAENAVRRCVLLLLALALLPACRGEAPEPSLAGGAAGRNVVLLTVDTLRADRLGAYGYAARPNSPRIDALLASGALFERAVAPRSITWPSLASVLTGLYPSSHGVILNGYELADELDLLPEALQRAGYRTGAFLSNMCRANHHGWDALACSGGNDGKAVREALDWIAGGEPERPFFVWLHLFGAHSPYYNGGDRAARELDPGYDGPLGTKKWKLNRVMTEQLELTERDLVHLDALYDAAVMGTDGLVGRFLDGVAAVTAPEDNVVAFLSDHGEELYDHNQYLFHACSVYETTLHVPLGVAAPGLIDPGIRIPQAVELIDVAPTLLELAGLAPLAGAYGVSLVERLESPRARVAGRPAFSEYGTDPIWTVLAGRWKLVHNPEGRSPVCLADAPPDHYPIGETELYDLETDPGETTDLAGELPERAAQLIALIERRFASLESRAGEQELPEDLKKELEALGYVAR